MARIGFMPSRTSVEVRDPDGDVGTIPAATEGAAGVMTAQHVRLLEEVATWRRQQAEVVTPAMTIIERPTPDLSRFATREELRALAPQPPDLQEIAAAVRALVVADHVPAPAVLDQGSGEIVDQTAREVLSGVVEAYRALDARLQAVEQIIAHLRTVAAEQTRRAAA